MKTSIKKALDRWVKLLNHTVSHPEDMNRFNELVYECIKEDNIKHTVSHRGIHSVTQRNKHRDTL